MTDVNQLITDHLEIWTSAIEKKSGAGRGNGKAVNLYGIKKLRLLILELAVRGKLVPQDPADGKGPNPPKRQSKPHKNGAVDARELAFEPPENWSEARFGDFFSLEYGDNLPDKKRSQTGEIAVYGSNGVVGTHNSACVYSPCIVVGRKGSAGALNLCLDEACWVTDVAYSSIPPEGVDIHYAMILFSTLGLDTLGKGIKPGLSRNEAYALPIALPPLAEQHRIVAKVDELMGLCDTLEAQAEDSLKAHQTLVETCLATLTNSQTHQDLAQNWTRLGTNFDNLFTTEESVRSLREAILEWAVRGLLSEPSEADSDASEFLRGNLAARAELQRITGDARLKRCAETLLEEYQAPLPADWSAASFDELFLFIDYRGRTPKKTESGTPLITAKNVRMGQLNREPREFVSDATYAEWMNRGFPRVGDLFFTTEAPLANVCINDIDEPFALAQRVICLQPISQINTKYFEIAIRSKPVQEMIDRNGTGMTAKGIKASKLKPLAIPFPPLEVQDRIVAKVQQLDAVCDNIASSMKQAEQFKLSLADCLTVHTNEIAA